MAFGIISSDHIPVHCVVIIVRILLMSVDAGFLSCSLLVCWWTHVLANPIIYAGIHEPLFVAANLDRFDMALGYLQR